MATFLLYESASGYALFEAGDMDEIGQTQEAVQDTITCVRRPAFSIGEVLPRRAASRARARGSNARARCRRAARRPNRSRDGDRDRGRRARDDPRHATPPRVAAQNC